MVIECRCRIIESGRVATCIKSAEQIDFPTRVERETVTFSIARAGKADTGKLLGVLKRGRTGKAAAGPCFRDSLIPEGPRLANATIGGPCIGAVGKRDRKSTRLNSSH